MKRRIVSLAATAAVVGAGVFAVAGGLTAAASSAASGLPTLTLALNGKTVVVGGSTVSGAVNVQTTVTKEQAGFPALIQLKPGASLMAAFRAVGSHHGDFNYLDPYGSVVFDGQVQKGGVGSSQTVLAPGAYVALDIGGKGMPPFAMFTVTQAVSPASLPKPQATERTIEFGFRGPTTLHNGELVRFQNDGFLVHMNVWEATKNRKVAKQVVKLLREGKGNQANNLGINGGTFAGPLSSGAMQQQVITEKPGIYVQACFMNTQDGREHTQLGMERIIKIVK
jgi:hypothetical protein